MHDDYTFLPIAETLPRDLHFLSRWHAPVEQLPLRQGQVEVRPLPPRAGLHALPDIGATPMICTEQVTQERFLANLVADSERFAERARQEAPLPDNVVRLSAYRPKKKGS